MARIISCQRFSNNLFTTLDRTISRNIITLRSGQYHDKNSFYIKRNIFRNFSNLNNFQHLSAPTLNEKNIFKSTIPHIQNYRGMLVHEFVWQNADKWWNKIALECAITGKSYTYEQLRKLSGKFATSLRRNNLRPGDTIAAVLPNVIDYAIISLGASEAGIKVTLVNPMYTVEEIKRQLVDSDTVAVVTIPSRYSVVTKSIIGNSVIRLPVIIIDGYGSVPSDSINFKDLISDNIEEFEKTGKKTEQDPEDDTFIVPYSSGTTGLPKGVEVTHRNVVANCCQCQDEKITFAREAVGNHQEIVPLILPIFHTYGFLTLTNSLSIGAKIIGVPQFSSTILLKVLKKHNVTDLYLAPPIVHLIANDARFTPQHMKHVKLITSGAAPMSPNVVENFLRRCGNHLPFCQGYGLSETSPVVSKSKKGPLESSGLLVPSTEIRIVGCEDNNKGRNLRTKDIGEIYVRGPQVMKGYYKNPQATQDCMEENWFKTGDLGCIDDQGFLYIHGRLKELIKVQGYQVAPAELEDILQGHEKVADAAVIGVPHEIYGEIPKAFIVPKPNVRIDEQDIKDYVAKNVINYKQLGYVVAIDAIPKNAAGKILRRELQKM